MRVAVAVCSSVLLVAGCSQGATVSGPTESPTSAPPSTSKKAQATTTTPAEAAQPKPGAPFDAVAKWIAQGAPIDVGKFHSATNQGQSTDLGDDVAFVLPSGKTRCSTWAQAAPNSLQCLTKLTNPPPRPANAEGEWISGWINYAGKKVTVGSLHGDPGPFIAGDGNTLDYGGRLTFNDFDCRAETSGLFCADTKARTAVQISDAGVQPFGCLQKVTPDTEVAIGLEFDCPS